MTIDEVVARIESELPGRWAYLCGMCDLSAHAHLCPNFAASDELRAVDERFAWGFDEELFHTTRRAYSCAEALASALVIN